MSSDLIERLKRLAHGFSALAASEEAAEALGDQALAFRRMARNPLTPLGAEVPRWADQLAVAAAAAAEWVRWSKEASPHECE